MSLPRQCPHRAQSCCRHIMVKLLDDGTFLISGEEGAHTSLDALVTFYQQHPVWPHEELLTQPCGQVRVETPVCSSHPPMGQAPQAHFAPTVPFHPL